MGTIPSYQKVWNTYHKNAQGVLDGNIVVQEKVDGSQFSFMLDPGGSLHFRSKGKELVEGDIPKMFTRAVDGVRELESVLEPGFVYRGEAVTSPRHNTLKYERTPERFVILYDVEQGPGSQNYLPPDSLFDEADRLSMEAVPVYYYGSGDQFDLKTREEEILQEESILGGTPIEGFVIKNYGKFGPDGKVLCAKVVAPSFKERNKREWKKQNPSQGDVVQGLVDTFKTEARWDKAIQHLREQGKLQDDMPDLALLIPELKRDLEDECREEIERVLWEWAWPKVSRAITSGFPEYYENILSEESDLYN